MIENSLGCGRGLDGFFGVFFGWSGFWAVIVHREAIIRKVTAPFLPKGVLYWAASEMSSISAFPALCGSQ